VPIDRHAGRILAMLAASGGDGRGYDSVEERRRSMAALVLATQGEPPEQASVRDMRIDGNHGTIGVRFYQPHGDEGRTGPALVFFHGGGWVAGGLETHDGLCRRLAAASGCAVMAADYRLAPEHPFPAGLDDCRAALEWTIANAGELGIDAGRVGVAGDSAGGGLAAAVCQAARDARGPAIALQLLICPILDALGGSGSRRRLARDHFVDEATLDRDLGFYCRPEERGDPRVSPLRAADHAGMPPTLIHSAEFDPFVDEAEAYGAALAGAGGSARVTRHPGMIHFFYAMPAAIPYASTAIAAIGRQVGEALARTG
jgi:acetyl esterase/lipase